MNYVIHIDYFPVKMSKLGTCCICGGKNKVHTIVMLPFKAPMPGRGWGCVVCGLPNDGAAAVVCDKCLSLHQWGDIIPSLQWICTGFAGEDGRTPLAGYKQIPHEHDQVKHKFAEAEWGHVPPS